MKILDLVPIVISIISILGTLFTYIKHDKKIKKQEALLNQYQINKIEVEKTERKKALVKALCYDEGQAGKKLRIYNAGIAKATNVRIEFVDGLSSDVVEMEQFPFRLLNPQDYTDIIFNIYSCSKTTITVQFIWDDDFQKDNTFEQDFTVR